MVLGGGTLYEITDQDDAADAGMKLELGMEIYQSFGFCAGIDFMPAKGDKDQMFIYGMIDLMPPIGQVQKK